MKRKQTNETKSQREKNTKMNKSTKSPNLCEDIVSEKVVSKNTEIKQHREYSEQKQNTRSYAQRNHSGDAGKRPGQDPSLNSPWVGHLQGRPAAG